MISKINCIFLFTFLLSKIVSSQEFSENLVSETAYQHQLNFGTDNDFFAVFTNKDRSYTFGVNAAYRFIPKEENFITKILPNKKHSFHDISIHLEAYTPNYNFETGVPNGERPFAGWAYTTLATRYIYEKSFVTLKADVGVLGDISQAGTIQNWFHENVSGDTVLKGWENQIPNQLGVNLKANYFHDIIGNSWYNIFGSGEASLGNVRTYIIPKIYMRIGRFYELGKTTSLNNSILQPKNAIEYFIQASAGYKLIAYDATLQGNIFSDSQDNRTTDDIDHTTFHANFGAYAAYHRFNLGVIYHFNSGEIANIKTHSYVSINLDYKF
ncbi:lipid A deacylase LpxR family protein [Mesonia aestuariivivens]|uniref:Lipid A deacylase LpxR family protein n=1 Tax=Mesonia aestuariivivens TaxID=2796128 RepID=A0ABS6W4H0_9FLAO|nr:lipid A deacylase LpxR family protein [Mesonia aestuariivivens]MBW2962023.1 lipid A deacylase LpxR family protein [Mesonia aestuariivivens]